MSDGGGDGVVDDPGVAVGSARAQVVVADREPLLGAVAADGERVRPGRDVEGGKLEIEVGGDGLGVGSGVSGGVPASVFSGR